MKLYRDHVVIALDDDIGYPKNTFETFFNAYIDNNLNIICCRWNHLMLSKIKKVYKKETSKNEILSPDFNITLTHIGGSFSLQI